MSDYDYSENMTHSENASRYDRNDMGPNPLPRSNRRISYSDFDEQRDASFYQPPNGYYSGYPPVGFENEYSGYYDIDAQLANFVDKHNVLMDDGAVVYKTPIFSAGRGDKIRKKRFIPPCGCTRNQFIIGISFSIFFLLLIIVAMILGIVFGGEKEPKFPMATPWWKHGVIYQLNVRTWANDVEGVIGRLKDATSRMVYLSKRIHASAAIITELLEGDKNGVRNWRNIDPSLNPDGDAILDLLTALKDEATKDSIQLILGVSLYATSLKHPWFISSVENIDPHFQSFYIWRREAPLNSVEARYISYNSVRKEYYRHIHGNPNTPLLNLSNINVRNELISAINYWKETLGISGIMIKNSTNVLNEMSDSLKMILESSKDDDGDTFTWFADAVDADRILQNPRHCYFELLVNERVISRTEDISTQLEQITVDPRLSYCSPVWRIERKYGENADLFTLQTLASILPGMYLISAGEEVELTTGNFELMEWKSVDRMDYSTYWPLNAVIGIKANQRIIDWTILCISLERARMFSTAWADNRVTVSKIPRTENLLVVEREYQPTGTIVTFFVSFQTLNAYTNLADVVRSSSRDVSIIYERMFLHGTLLSRNWMYLTNNDVFVVFN